MIPPMSDTISPPKNVSSSHAPNPISADVAARRTTTDSSIPNASHSETYTNVSEQPQHDPQDLGRSRHDAEADDPEGGDHADDRDEHEPDDREPGANLPLTTSSRWIGWDRSRGSVPSARSPLIASNANARPSSGAT